MRATSHLRFHDGWLIPLRRFQFTLSAATGPAGNLIIENRIERKIEA